ncbi:alpha/beta fold hydrolase [Micromonospora sp. LH3U1]|uniref:alpha/beta fold hydrolase n=1 Tax=Micromonospora sp. LH3U1 TaxID=3018339 RepID=UPI00234B5A38|nr:alpha/beta hydrolase [Micromonospora sp. LH3U1]WCN78676.1 alpha/beta hydrolase [Micromonospora sp. LH3U1]
MSTLLFLHDADVLPGPVGALNLLADDLDVVVPRHPGFGSPLDNTTQEWDTVADLAQHYLSGPAAELAHAPLHLAGAGFGGWIALDMAVRAPHLFTSLLLVSPYGVKLSGPTEPDFADILLLDPTEVVELGWADPTACHDLRMPGYPTGLTDNEYERAFADRAALSRYAWKPFLHDPRLRRWLHLATMPTLILAGTHDRLVPPRHSAALADLLPSARFVDLPHAGHYPYLERPDEFHRLVRSFLIGEAQ